MSFLTKSPKVSYRFIFSKIISSFVSFVKHYFLPVFSSCCLLFSSSFIISGFNIFSEINFFIDSEFLVEDSKDFNASTCFYPCFSIVFVCFFQCFPERRISEPGLFSYSLLLSEQYFFTHEILTFTYLT